MIRIHATRDVCLCDAWPFSFYYYIYTYISIKDNNLQLSIVYTITISIYDFLKEYIQQFSFCNNLFKAYKQYKLYYWHFEYKLN